MNLTGPTAIVLKPTSYAPDPTAVAADLRAIADVIEGNPFLASLITQAFDRSLFPEFAAAQEQRDDSRELMAETIRQLKPLASRSIEKKYGDRWFHAVIPLRTISLTLTDEREAVCTRIVTGTETVTEEVPDPEALAAVPTITQTRELVEWSCEPLMGSTK